MVDDTRRPIWQRFLGLATRQRSISQSIDNQINGRAQQNNRTTASRLRSAAVAAESQGTVRHGLPICQWHGCMSLFLFSPPPPPLPVLSLSPRPGPSHDRDSASDRASYSAGRCDDGLNRHWRALGSDPYRDTGGETRERLGSPEGGAMGDG